MPRASNPNHVQYGTANSNPPPRTKRRRNGRACDQCHKRSIKCAPSDDGKGCQRCKTLAVACTYYRPVKRRGPPPSRASKVCDGESTAAAPYSSSRSPSIVERHMVAESTTPSNMNLLSPQEEEIISPKTIESLADVFYHIVYPILPYFHWPTFRSKIHEKLYLRDKSFLLVTMAVCSVAAKRLCFGVPTYPSSDSLYHEAPALSSKCYNAALRALPNCLTEECDYYTVMKAKALLSSTCLQNGDSQGGMIHLGDYVCLATTTRFHMEEDWPAGLTEIEKQERRRLFWGAYQQEQYIAINFDSISRLREIKATVLYPAEVYDDEDISDTNIKYRENETSFLRGWNFCTDLYRLIEYTDGMIRLSQRPSRDESADTITSFLSRQGLPKDFASESLSLISSLYEKLPQKLKQVRAITGDVQEDRLGFIASNVLITTQTLKMILASAEKSNVHQRCAIVSELLDNITTIPLNFFQASSTCSLRQLAHVGHLLGSMIYSPLSPWTHLQLRNILHVLATILEKLESKRPPAAGIASRLKAQIARIDQFREESSPDNEHDHASILLGRDFLTGIPETNMSTLSHIEAITPHTSSLEDNEGVSFMDIPNVPESQISGLFIISIITKNLD